MLYKRCDCPAPTKCLHAYYYRFELNGRDYDRSTKTAKRKLAESIESKARVDVLEQKHEIAPRKAVKFTVHLENYLLMTAKTNKTAYKDRAVLERLSEDVGLAKMVDEISSFDIERWKFRRSEAVCQNTVNRELHIVRGCFSRAVDAGLIDISPARQPRKGETSLAGREPGVAKFRTDDVRIRVFDDQELATLLAIEDPFVGDLCRATLETLARISELLSLHRRHIGPTWIERKLKGGKVIRVAVTQSLRQRLLARASATTGMVFGDSATGRAPTQQTASKRVITAFLAAGLADASHHTCRHTGVTLMLEQGANPRTIQKLAGWSSLRMLERYGHTRDAEAQKAVSGIAEHLSSIEVATKSATLANGADLLPNKSNLQVVNESVG